MADPTGDGLTGWVLSLVWPIVQRVLTALGLGTIAYTGLSSLGDSITNLVVAQWGQLGGAVLAIASLGGIPQAIGIILGALAARLTYLALSKIGRMLL